MSSISLCKANRSSVERGKDRNRLIRLIQNGEGITECPFYFFWRAYDCGGIGYSPVGRHRLAGPKWAYFFGSVVANSEDKVKCGASGLANSSQDLLRRTLVPSPAARVA